MAATTFDEIYDRFMPKITDFTLVEMNDSDFYDTLEIYLISAVAKVRELKIGGFEIDEVNKNFAYNLSNLEKEIVALGMVQEWLEPQLNSVLLTKQYVSSKEENFFAQHNHLNMLRNLKNDIHLEKQRLVSRYKLLHNKYLRSEVEPRT